MGPRVALASSWRLASCCLELRFVSLANHSGSWSLSHLSLDLSLSDQVATVADETTLLQQGPYAMYTPGRISSFDVDTQRYQIKLTVRISAPLRDFVA